MLIQRSMIKRLEIKFDNTHTHRYNNSDNTSDISRSVIFFILIV